MSNRINPKHHHNPQSTGSRVGLWIMGTSVIFFTGNTLILQYLGSIRSVDPTVALVFRAGVGIGIVTLFYRFKKQVRLPLEWRPILRDKGLLWRGLTGIAGTFAFYITVPTLGSGTASLLCNTYVLFAAIFAALTIGEALGKRKISWMGIAFLGVSLLLGKASTDTQSSSLNSHTLFYMIIGILGAIASATTVVLIRRLTLRFSNGTIFLTQCLWVGAAALPFAIPHLSAVSLLEVGLLCLAASMASVGQLMMNEGYRRLTVATGSALQNTWPILTTIGGVVLFGDRFTLIQLVGSALILLGTWQVARRMKA